jgi:hypothetical protein
MTLPNQGTIDLIATQILVDIKGVLDNLNKLDPRVNTSSERIKVLATELQAWASVMGISVDGLTQRLRAMNAALGSGGIGISNQELNKANGLANGIGGIGKAAEKTKAPIQNIGNEMEKSSKKSKWSIDVVRTALGVLTAMLVNVVLSAFIDFFKKSIQGAMDLEKAMWRVNNAEIALSKVGVDISMKGLTEGAEKIAKELEVFTSQEVLEALSDAASGLAKFGFTEEQLLTLTRGAAIMNKVTNSGATLEATMNEVMSSLISPQGKSIASLNIGFGEVVMTAKALELQLIRAGEAASDLTAEENRQVKYAVFLDEVARNAGTFGEYLDTNAAKIERNTAAWKNLQNVFGQTWNNMIPELTPIFEWLQKEMERASLEKLFKKATPEAERFSNTYGKIVARLEMGTALTEEEYEYLKNTISLLSAADILKAFPDPAAIKNPMVRELVQDLIDLKTAAENVPDPLIPPATATQEETEAFNELSKGLAEVAAEAQNALDELELLSKQKAFDIHADLLIDIEDIDIEFAQKMEDVERDLQQTLEDIAIDTQNKIADLKTQAREDEMRAELEFQQKMKELRQRFLMDLDDALHARDARQVLRLIKQYEADKKNALDQKNLEDKLRREKLAADIKAARLEEQRKIAEAQREAARKMQELEIEKQREIAAAYEKEARKLEDLKLWNQREAEEIARHAQEKNDKLVAAYIAAVGVHSFYEGQINKLIAGYSAANIAAIDAMYAHMAGVYAGISAMYASGMGMINGLGAAGGGGGGGRVPMMAEGGTFVANKPTLAIFGERGRERATFTPLDRTGRDVNKIFGNTSGLGGGGELKIEMLLSPDLEARIIENTMSRTADVVLSINRSKA